MVRLLHCYHAVGCQILAHVLAVVEQAEQLCTAGGLETIFAVMETHASVATVQVCAVCMCMLPAGT